jgi:hypothetical protein
MRNKMSSSNKNNCNDKSFSSQTEFKKLKNVLVLEHNDNKKVWYICFSCNDARTTLSSRKYLVGPLIHKTLEDDHKIKLEEFINNTCKDDFSDSEYSESSDDSSESDSKISSDKITSKDAIQILKDMEIYEKFKNERHILPEVQRYVNVKFRELGIDEEEIPKYVFSNKTGNIHQSHYDYYKKVFDILDEFGKDDRDEFIHDYSNEGGTRDKFSSKLSEEENEIYQELFLNEVQDDEELEDLDDDYTFFEEESKRLKIFGRNYIVIIGTHDSGKNIGYVYDENKIGSEPVAKFYEGQFSAFSENPSDAQLNIINEITRIYFL